jgi:hypothetical protein
MYLPKLERKNYRTWKWILATQNFFHIIKIDHINVCLIYKRNFNSEMLVVIIFKHTHFGFLFCFVLLYFVSVTGYYCVAQAGLKLKILLLPVSAGITEVYHHIWLKIHFESLHLSSDFQCSLDCTKSASTKLTWLHPQATSPWLIPCRLFLCLLTIAWNP